MSDDLNIPPSAVAEQTERVAGVPSSDASAVAEPLDASPPCNERFAPTCIERFSEALGASEKPRKPAASSNRQRPYHSALEKPLPGMSTAEVWSRLGFGPFKTKSRFSNRKSREALTLLMLAANRLSPLTHEITLTIKPGSKQTIEYLLHRLRAYCRKHASQSLSYVGPSTNLPHRHGHFYVSLVEKSQLYDAVLDFVAKHAGLDRGKVWFSGGKDDELRLGQMQKLRNDARHGTTGLNGAFGKIGYALHHFDDIAGVAPKVEIHASEDIRDLARRMSEDGLQAEVQPAVSDHAHSSAGDQPLDLGPMVLDEAEWRRHTDWDRLFSQESPILVRVVENVRASGASKTLAVRKTLDAWFRYHGYEAGANLSHVDAGR